MAFAKNNFEKKHPQKKYTLKTPKNTVLQLSPFWPPKKRPFVTQNSTPPKTRNLSNLWTQTRVKLHSYAALSRCNVVFRVCTICTQNLCIVYTAANSRLISACTHGAHKKHGVHTPCHACHILLHVTPARSPNNVTTHLLRTHGMSRVSSLFFMWYVKNIFVIVLPPVFCAFHKKHIVCTTMCTRCTFCAHT